MDPAQELFNEILTTAAALNLRCTEDPVDLSHVEMKSAVDARGIVSAFDTGACLYGMPKGAKSLYIDNQALIIGSFGLDDDSPENCVEAILLAYLRHAAISLSWLDIQRENLGLFLAGPYGSSNNPKWQEIALRVERNENVCRKLVWLPPAPAEDKVTSLKAFCGRTFLARPWKHRIHDVHAELDPIGRIAAKSPINKEWLQIIEESVEGNDVIAERLISSWERDKRNDANIPAGS